MREISAWVWPRISLRSIRATRVASVQLDTGLIDDGLEARGLVADALRDEAGATPDQRAALALKSSTTIGGAIVPIGA